MKILLKPSQMNAMLIHKYPVSYSIRKIKVQKMYAEVFEIMIDYRIFCNYDKLINFNLKNYFNYKLKRGYGRKMTFCLHRICGINIR